MSGGGQDNHAVAFPILRGPRTEAIDRVVRRVGVLPIRCLVCGGRTIVPVTSHVYRETCVCPRCGALNRQRQIAYVIGLGFAGGRRIPSLAELAARQVDLAVYHTEAARALHWPLRSLPGYRCSEYVLPGLPGGTVVDGVEHQDLQSLSFDNESFDLVISSEVLEHVADPYRAHAEIHRVLRPGGRHVFTVPFMTGSVLDDVRARLGADGRPEFFAEPEYHGDSVRSEGCLAYTIFGLEMLVKLGRLGFQVTVHHLHSLRYGILGPDALVFEAQRLPSAAPDFAAAPTAPGRAHQAGGEGLPTNASTRPDRRRPARNGVTAASGIFTTGQPAHASGVAGRHMTFGEHAAVIGFLGDVTPSLAIAVGTGAGGAVEVVARASAETHVFSPTADSRPEGCPAVTMHPGDCGVLLPRFLDDLSAAGRTVDFVLFDGGLCPDAVFVGVAQLLASDCVARTVILVLDSGNADLRASLDRIDWAAHPKVRHVDMAAVPGRVCTGGPFAGHVRGGLGLVLVDVFAPARVGSPVQSRFERLETPPDTANGGPAPGANRLQVEAMLDAVLNSTSWRVTAPLRWAGALLRGRRPGSSR